MAYHSLEETETASFIVLSAGIALMMFWSFNVWLAGILGSIFLATAVLVYNTTRIWTLITGT